MRIIPSLFLLALFFLNPATAAGKELPKVAIWDLAAGNIPLTHAQDLTSILVSEIVKLKKYEVYSQDNVRAIAGWTEERIKLGCTDSKCLTALGQLDIAKLISGRVGKIGNTYSVSWGLFDTQNARSENAISEFCRTEDELIILVQQAIRKLLGVQADPPPSPAAAVDKMPPPSKSPSSAPVFLEIKTKVKGAEVLVDGQNMGVVPLRISGLSPGPHELQVVKKGYEDWKQQILIQPDEKKVVEVSLKPSKQSEDSLLNRIFYLENCFFGREEFWRGPQGRVGRPEQPNRSRSASSRWMPSGQRKKAELSFISIPFWGWQRDGYGRWRLNWIIKKMVFTRPPANLLRNTRWG
jgi:hypothetical protein